MDKDVTLVKSEIVYRVNWQGCIYMVKDYYDINDKSKNRFECFDVNGKAISDVGLVSFLFNKCELFMNKLGEKVE